MQTERIKDWKFNVQISATDDTPSPPDYDKFTLFHSEVENYAMSQTSLASTNLQRVATLTEEQDMFMPCMVGTLESQFLKMMCQIKNARKCLDVGTFTGMSALAMAEGMGDLGTVPSSPLRSPSWHSRASMSPKWATDCRLGGRGDEADADHEGEV